MGRSDDPVALRVAILDQSLDGAAAMWGDAAGCGETPAISWALILAAAGVPFSGGRDPDGGGLLLVPDPHAYATAVDEAQETGRPLLTGPPPETPTECLAAVRDALGALVRPDLRGVLVLRLDDPGASVREHLRSWAHPDVDARAWAALWEELRRLGRASIFCCPGWVDADGSVHDSRRRDPALWRALDEGVRRGVADLECHGYTHLTPDLADWVSAPDRATEPSWYREFWPPRRQNEPDADEQAARIAAWQAACGPGTTLVAPGEAWGLATIAAARARGLQLFCSWSVCRLQLPVPTWSAAIGSPYLDEADSSHLVYGLPAVGYWHDRDMALHGPDWVGDRLDEWRDCGVTRAWAFADLARAYSVDIDASLVGGEVVVASAPDVPLLVERARH